jgi:PAS domain S-box-containing protein
MRIIDAKRDPLALTPKSKLPVFVPFEGDGRDVEHFAKEDGFKWTREVMVRTWQTLETVREAEELHRLLFEKVPHPRLVCDARTLRILVVNAAAVRRYGYSRDEFLHMKVTELSAPGRFPDFKRYSQKLSSHRFVPEDGQGAVFHHRKNDGRLIDIEVDATPITLRGRRMFLLLVQDVTERERVARRLRAQQATTRALAESSTLAEASPKIFRAICENLGCDWGELWRVDPIAQVLRCTQVWHPHNQPLPRMERAAHRAACARGEGIAGLVWARNRPIWIADLSG